MSTTFNSLISPSSLQTLFPLAKHSAEKIKQTRLEIARIMRGLDNRLLVVVGPCSIHDPIAALEYATLLQQASVRYIDDLFIVMRTYFEKPRTTLGWKGLINDPLLDGSFNINAGLKLSRDILLQINALNLPMATEFLDPFTPTYLSDLISWSAIGARTVESPLHREFASGLTMPVGFKNTLHGEIKVAIEAIKVANHSHHIISLSPKGEATLVRTLGNLDGHIILRGGYQSPNYSASHLQYTQELLKQAHLDTRIMIDCSHGNSQKIYKKQLSIAETCINLIKKGYPLSGIMLESHLNEGKQVLTPNKPLIFGQSITDACLGWADTGVLLEKLAIAIKSHNSFIKQ